MDSLFFKKKEVAESLKRLSKNIISYYVDYKLMSKNAIHELNTKTKNRQFQNNIIGAFTLSTCLRQEIYSFGSKKSVDDENYYACLSGKLALRRLITIACGLHSEIIGEKEIFLQLGNSILFAYDQSLISKMLCSDLLNILYIADELKKKFSIQTDENYSTVGVSIMAGFANSNSTLCIIGSGYMAHVFIKNFKSIEYKKIIWISRDIDRLKKIVGITGVDKDKVVYVETKDAIKYIQEADLIFAATNNTDTPYRRMLFPKAKAIIDVSYPSLFSEGCNSNFISIQNTFFEKLISKPVDKISILKVEKAIDKLLKII